MMPVHTVPSSPYRGPPPPHYSNNSNNMMRGNPPPHPAYRTVLVPMQVPVAAEGPRRFVVSHDPHHHAGYTPPPTYYPRPHNSMYRGPGAFYAMTPRPASPRAHHVVWNGAVPPPPPPPPPPRPNSASCFRPVLPTPRRVFATDTAVENRTPRSTPPRQVETPKKSLPFRKRKIVPASPVPETKKAKKQEDAEEMDAARALINLAPSPESVPEEEEEVVDLAEASPQPRNTSLFRPLSKGGRTYHSTVTPNTSFDHVPTLKTPPPPHQETKESQDAKLEESPSSSSASSSTLSPRTPPKYYSGSVPLCLPQDEDVLSPLHCFMRRYCVEAFSASEEDVATPRYGKSHGLKVQVGQVGIRCQYCSHRPFHQRAERSVCFPSSLKNIYHSMETWQRRHSLVCRDLPVWVRNSLQDLLEDSRSRAGGRRQYWEDSAQELGMKDTPHGVRWIRPPGILAQTAPKKRDLSVHAVVPPACVAVGSPMQTNFPSPSIVRPHDKALVTDFLYLLLDQMEKCTFREEDRSGGRSKVKTVALGTPGLQCRHCQGKAGFGRYFPSSVQALSLANSDRNIYNHLQKCRKCPQYIREELERHSKVPSSQKNRRGLRKTFFQRVWGRMYMKEECPATSDQENNVNHEECPSKIAV